jgi:hypothetical protein
MLMILPKPEKLLILWFKITDKDLQKEIYFNPSMLRDVSELQLLRHGKSGNLWVFQASESGYAVAEDMMLNKLIANPKLLNDQPDRYDILRFTGKERLHFVRKQMEVRKVLLLGVPAVAFGIHIQCPLYQIVEHAGIHILLMDAPEKMPGLAPNVKGQLASVLKTFHEL